MEALSAFEINFHLLPKTQLSSSDPLFVSVTRQKTSSHNLQLLSPVYANDATRRSGVEQERGSTPYCTIQHSQYLMKRPFGSVRLFEHFRSKAINRTNQHSTSRDFKPRSICYSNRRHCCFPIARDLRRRLKNSSHFLLRQIQPTAAAAHCSSGRGRRTRTRP